MKRIAMVIAALLIASSAEACWRCGRANCCGIPTCIFAPVIETVAVETAPPIVWHQDGTYWQGSFEVIEGKVLDRSSPTGWRVYWYQKPFASYAGAQSN